MSLSALRASSSRLPRATAAAAASRSIFSHANTQAASPRNAAASSGAIGGVDPRVLTGVPGFVGKEQMSRVNEWQATLWERLQAEVRSESSRGYVSDVLVKLTSVTSLYSEFRLANLTLTLLDCHCVNSRTFMTHHYHHDHLDAFQTTRASPPSASSGTTTSST